MLLSIKSIPNLRIVLILLLLSLSTEKTPSIPYFFLSFSVLEKFVLGVTGSLIIELFSCLILYCYVLGAVGYCVSLLFCGNL